jgi:hypothetical protein
LGGYKISIKNLSSSHHAFHDNPEGTFIPFHWAVAIPYHFVPRVGSEGGGCVAPVSSLGAVFSWEEEFIGRDGEAKAVLDSYCVANVGGVVRVVAP